MNKIDLIGEVIEFHFGEYLAYALITHFNQRYGYLARLFEPKFKSQIEDIQSLRHHKFRMNVYMPLNTAIRGKGVKVRGKLELKKEELSPPTFRSPMVINSSGVCPGWEIIGGEKTTRVPALTREQSKYSDIGIYNLAAIKYQYDNNLFPNSIEKLNNGPIAFEP